MSASSGAPIRWFFRAGCRRDRFGPMRPRKCAEARRRNSPTGSTRVTRLTTRSRFRPESSRSRDLRFIAAYAVARTWVTICWISCSTRLVFTLPAAKSGGPSRSAGMSGSSRCRRPRRKTYLGAYLKLAVITACKPFYWIKDFPPSSKVSLELEKIVDAGTGSNTSLRRAGGPPWFRRRIDCLMSSFAMLFSRCLWRTILPGGAVP